MDLINDLWYDSCSSPAALGCSGLYYALLLWVRVARTGQWHIFCFPCNPLWKNATLRTESDIWSTIHTTFMPKVGWRRFGVIEIQRTQQKNSKFEIVRLCSEEGTKPWLSGYLACLHQHVCSLFPKVCGLFLNRCEISTGWSREIVVNWRSNRIKPL